MRLLWRALRRLGPHRIWLVHHPGYAQTISHIPLDPERGERIAAFLREGGYVRRLEISRPRPASLQDLLRVHPPAHVESLDRTEVVSQAIGVPVTDLERQRAVDQQRLVTGGTIRAIELALRTGRPTVNLGGGLHHATPTQGMGFCLVNDIAIGIAHARHRGFMGRVLVIDLDLHDGNGTRAAFAADPSVHTFSIHNQDWEPQGGQATTAIALGTAVDDARFLAVLRESLPPVVADHRPTLVIYVAGTDPAEDDRLGDWKLSREGMLARDRFVIETLRRATPGVPLVILLAGGYGREAWRYTARFLAWLVGGTPAEPPDDLELMLRRYRRTGLHREDPDDWGLTEGDLFAVVPGAGPGTRVLGAFSRHAVELSLQEVGILDRVRALGFPHPSVEIAFDSGLGETIRLYGDSEHTELLMELRVNRNRRVVPGMEVLCVEWLRLQNPRAAFGPPQPRLPGQEHPGLGLLREVVAWLVLLCERLKLDGLASTPAQYFMAVLGRHHLRFVDPVAQARFDALYDVLGGMPLGQAEATLAANTVLDADSGRPVRWEPALQVLPVSDRLRELVKAPDMPAQPRQRFVIRPPD